MLVHPLQSFPAAPSCPVSVIHPWAPPRRQRRPLRVACAASYSTWTVLPHLASVATDFSPLYLPYLILDHSFHQHRAVHRASWSFGGICTANGHSMTPSAPGFLSWDELTWACLSFSAFSTLQRVLSSIQVSSVSQQSAWTALCLPNHPRHLQPIKAGFARSQDWNLRNFCCKSFDFVAFSRRYYRWAIFLSFRAIVKRRTDWQKIDRDSFSRMTRRLSCADSNSIHSLPQRRHREALV